MALRSLIRRLNLSTPALSLEDPPQKESKWKADIQTTLGIWGMRWMYTLTISQSIIRQKDAYIKECRRKRGLCGGTQKIIHDID